MATMSTPFLSAAAPEAPATSGGFVVGAPKAILRLEGAAVLAASLAAYSRFGADWVLFAALFLVPDLSMLGYFAGRRIGAVSYNLAHSYVLPIALATAGIALSRHGLPALSLIWVAHIGFDRMLGYGLKYPTAFGHTHLGLVGKMKRSG
jgi:hypothetical protein